MNSRRTRRRIPFLYEDVIWDDSFEPAFDKSLRVEDDRDELPGDFLRIYDTTRQMGWEELCSWYRTHGDDIPGIITVKAPDTVPQTGDRKVAVVAPAINDIRHINTLLSQTNGAVAMGGCIVVHGTTSSQRRRMLLKGNPFGLNWILYVADYFWSRVCPKLRCTRWFYMALTKGRNRNLPRVEILGRVSRAGFTIAGEQFRDGKYLLTAVKTAPPITDDKPSYGPLIRLTRVGYHGEIIGVYKLRTMYTYSEFIQGYAYRRLGLQGGGKINNDFRVNFWGKMLRPVFIDEVPMIINCLKRQLKIVGVRPVSRQYLSLYTPEMREYRKQVKPGLIPPFYYDRVRPVTIEDVQANERRYIEAYLKAPVRTDLRYFFVCLFNIVYHRFRSR